MGPLWSWWCLAEAAATTTSRAKSTRREAMAGQDGLAVGRAVLAALTRAAFVLALRASRRRNVPQRQPRAGPSAQTFAQDSPAHRPVARQGAMGWAPHHRLFVKSVMPPPTRPSSAPMAKSRVEVERGTVVVRASGHCPNTMTRSRYLVVNGLEDRKHGFAPVGTHKWLHPKPSCKAPDPPLAWNSARLLPWWLASGFDTLGQFSVRAHKFLFS